jgi:fibronectin-binding autotransporter adhesin
MTYMNRFSRRLQGSHALNSVASVVIVAKRSRRCVLPFRVSLLAATAFVLWGQPAKAATYYWNSIGTTTWNPSTTWSTNATGSTGTGAGPGSSDIAVFNGSSFNGTTTAQLSANEAVGTLEFNNTGATTIDSTSATAETLTIGNGGIIANGTAGVITIGNTSNPVNVAINANQNWTNNSGSALNIVGGVSTSASGTVTITSNAFSIAFKGNLTNGVGTLALTDAGNSGQVTLSGTNSYSGATTISNGIVEFTTTNAMSANSAITVASGATLAIELGGGTGSFTLATSGAGSLGNIFSGTGGHGITYTTGANVGVDTTGASGTYTGVLADNGSGAIHMGLTKLGSNTLTLTGANTYTGVTTISAGGLQLGSGGTTGALASSGNITDNATLTIDRSNAVTQNTDFSSSAITGSGALIQLGTGTTTLTAANAFTGATTVTAGRLQLGNGGTTGGLSGSGTITDNATFAVDRSNATAQGTDFSSKAISGTGTFAQLGSGTTYLNAANTYSGGTTISSGALVVTNGSGVGTGTVTVASGAAFNYAAASDAHLAVSGINITGGTNTTIGGSIGASTTSSEIAVTNAVATSGGNLTVNIYGESGVAPAAGTNTYTLVGTGLSSTWGVPTLGTVYNNTNFTVGALSNTTTSLNVAITSQTGLANAYWQGGLSGNSTVWAASDGSATSNWVATLGGSQQALVPGTTTTVFFSDTGSITPPTATTLGANMSIAGLVIQDTVNGLGLNGDGNTLTIGSGGITMNASVPASSIGANVALGSTQTWTNSSVNALTVSGIVTGTTTSNLTTAGSGTIILTNANTYTGTTTINSGSTLQLGNGGTVGSIVSTGSTTLNGTLAFDRSDSISQSTIVGTKVISGGGNIVQMGTGTLSLNEANTFTGGVNVLAGILTLGNVAGAGTGTISLGNGGNANATLNAGSGTYANNIATVAGSTGVLTITSPSSRPVFSGSITLGAGTTLTVAPPGQALTLSGNIGGTGNLALNIDNLSGGILLSGTTINNAGTIVTGNGGTAAVGASAIISGAIGSSVTGVTQNSMGTLILNGVNTYIGDTTVTSGTLNLSASASGATTAAQDSVVVMNGGAVTFGASTGTLVTSATLGGLAGSGNLNLDNAATSTSAVNLTIGNSNTSNGSNTLNPTYSGILSNTTGNASVTKVGSNSQTFSGANTYSGGTTVSGGTLVLANTSGSATGTGSLTVGANATLAGTGTMSSVTSGFTILGSSGNAATVLAGMTSLADTSTGTSLTLKGTASSITNANLVFNLSPTSTASSQLNVGSTAVTFGTGVNLTLNVNTAGGAVIPGYTPYVLIAGTGATGTGLANSQYSGLGTSGMDANGNIILTGLTFNFSDPTLQSWYGTNSYVFLYQNGTTDDIEIEVVPEPGTWAMMLGGLGLLILWQRRKQRRAGLQ